MKTKALLVWLIFFLGSSAVIAQEDEKFGDDPDKCRAKLSTYDQFFKQGSYKDAYPAWSWSFRNCPASTKNIYIQGPKIVETLIDESEGETKEAYIDTLLMIHDQRTEYFNQKGANLGRKAIDIMAHRPSKAMQAYRLFGEAVELTGNETSANVLGRYMQLATVLVQNEIIDPAEVIQVYANISGILDYQIKNEIQGVSRAKEQIDAMLINSGILDCDKLEEVFRPIYEKKKDDMDMLKTIQNIMEEEACFESALYAEVSEKMYELNKSSHAAHVLAQYFFKNNESEKAEKYYKEAIEMQEEESKKADLYFELALLYFNQMDQYTTAHSYANKAIGVDPNYGKAYKLIAQIYASVASDCGENDFEHQTVYWAVVDKLIRAKTVSPDLAEEVNPMITKYRQYFPTKKDAFFYEVTEGQAYTINCWIGETTTVRFIQ
jgi:tetratricopeptide (TPR) repeat protein